MNTTLNRRQLALGSVAALLGGPAIFSLTTRAAVGQDAAPAIAINSPAANATITTTDIVFDVTVSNFTLSCAASGAADEDGTGQILAFLDGSNVAQLTNIYCTSQFIIPGNGLSAGEHTIALVLASNTHVPNMDTAQTVTFTYQPEQPIPLPIANYTGAPAVTLHSPADGDTVAPQFEVQVTAENFMPTTGLEGKANVAGYGHYHVWVDTPEMPSSLAGLVLMPGTNGFTLDLSAWGEGDHQIRIETAQNDHTMYDPATAASFTVTMSNDATPAPEATAEEEASPVAEASGATAIEMTNGLKFSPDPLTVAAGQTVTWTNSSAMPHTTTNDPAKNPLAAQHPEYSQLPDGATPWDSGILQPGESFSYTFTVPGSYTYFCIPHVAAGMVGHIDVTG